MGATESRIGFLSYKEATKRVTQEELRRLKDAFKRASGNCQHMTRQCFDRDVLGHGVPPKLAEVIYASFGGSPAKGLHQQDLTVGMVLLIRGHDDEKAKYLFSLFATGGQPGGAMSHAARDDMEAVLRALDGAEVPPSLRTFFAQEVKVNYGCFRAWLLRNKEALTFAGWLLSGDMCAALTHSDGGGDAPTFHRTLARVTHFAESAVPCLEKSYHSLLKSQSAGRLDLKTFAPLVSPPVPASLGEGLFNAFDGNRDDHVDFEELCRGLSRCCRGTATERRTFCFQVFDADRDGALSGDELRGMVAALLEVWKDSRADALSESSGSASDIAEGILRTHDTTESGCLTLEDYLRWSAKSALADEFLDLLLQVCHVVLWLRPASPEEEGRIVRAWLERESRRGLREGQCWFIVSALWWRQWKDYVGYERDRSPSERPSVPSSPRSAARPVPVPGGRLRSPSEEERSRGSAMAPICPRQGSSRAPGQLPCHPPAAQRPGPIDNRPLVSAEPVKASLTGHGGRLKYSTPGQHFETVPKPVWKALDHWYGANLSLPRQVIRQSTTGQEELELFPRYLMILRQQEQRSAHHHPPPHHHHHGVGRVNITPASRNNAPPPPLKRALHSTGCFSRTATIKQVHVHLAQRLIVREEDTRLWLYDGEHSLTLLDDEEHTLESLEIQDKQCVFVEERNKDMSWPEEMSSIANNNNDNDDNRKIQRHSVRPTEKGATGLSNLGNSCFMNSSIQCVSNTRPLTDYFMSGRHLYELNRTNPVGMRGHMAKGYGDLVTELWSGARASVAPLRLRWTLARYAPRFNDLQQQDSQELLAFLLDGLHEDLNRVHDKPYVELQDSDGRPDGDVAAEAWENHLRRNRSVVVDLFHGQLRSRVACKTCGHVSARFDPFNLLSLPLPATGSVHLEVAVTRLDCRGGGGSAVRYGLRLDPDESYGGLKRRLGELCGLRPERILLADVHASCIKGSPRDGQRVCLSENRFLHAYEIPPLCPAAPTPADVARVGVDKPVLVADDDMPVSPETPMDEGGGVPGGVSGTTFQDQRPFVGYFVAMHRRTRTSGVFTLFQKNRPSLFGTPLIVPYAAHTSKKDLYDAVWNQVSRLLRPLPPHEDREDDDDGTAAAGEEYPFTLRTVDKDGLVCACCSWWYRQGCQGCVIECTEEESASSVRHGCIAVEWDSDALRDGRYQPAQERAVREHRSVAEARRAQAEPVTLDGCLRAFTGEEELGEEELYHCSKCKARRPATKKLELWRLPPILIIHLKRFQFVNGRWIKYNKVVKFPHCGFNPGAFLAPRDHTAAGEEQRYRGGDGSEGPPSAKDGEEDDDMASAAAAPSTGLHGDLPGALPASTTESARSARSLSRSPLRNTSRSASGERGGRGGVGGGRGSPERLPLRPPLTSTRRGVSRSNLGGGGGRREGQSTSAVAGTTTTTTSRDSENVCVEPTPCSDDGSSESAAPDQGAQEEEEEEGEESTYNLYAISCHSGIMGRGHYVTYAKNPNGRWYCYNDSSCREVRTEAIDTDSAYILFYERQGVDYGRFLPPTEGRQAVDTGGMDEDFESDYKKSCVLQ